MKPAAMRVKAADRDDRETYQERQKRQDAAQRLGVRRSAIRHVASHALDAGDARQLLEALDLDPREGRP